MRSKHPFRDCFVAILTRQQILAINLSKSMVWIVVWLDKLA